MHSPVTEAHMVVFMAMLACFGWNLGYTISEKVLFDRTANSDERDCRYGLSMTIVWGVMLGLYSIATFAPCAC